jgi:hypothetical protein
MTTEKITFEQIKPLLPKKTYLYYVDYRDSLDEHMDILQQCIHEQNQEPIDELANNWFDNPEWEQDKLDLQAAIEEKFDIEDAEDIVKEFQTEIEEHFYEVNDSDVIVDLLNNTNKQFMFYDTGYEMDSESWRWNHKRTAKEVVKILKHLGFKTLEITKMDRERGKNPLWTCIWDCVQNATYGGKLEIYFKDKVNDFFNIGEDYNVISFKNPTIGIINHGNGSGYQDEVKGYTIKLPLNPKNLFIEKTVSYNWSYDIAGMCHDAYDDCQVSFEKSKSKKILTISKLNAHIEKEAKLDAIFKAGSCTAGDMKYTRHRNTTYINNYPCGNKCMDCGTFWID